MIDMRDEGTTSELEWRVAHTLARCEKKVADWVRQQGWRAELPLYRSIKRYRGKRMEFHKPLFPGYVFVQIPTANGRKVQQHDQVARLLVPPDQSEFADQLSVILAAIEAGLEITPVRSLQPGTRVEIVSGPLRGMQGLVEKTKGFTEVVLRLDFISHAASVRIEPHEVEVLDAP
jgi:transcription antitermination factor NusG